MNPKTEALKFRIWQYASPKGWDVTVNDIADALEESPERVRAVCVAAGWMTRIRKLSDHRGQDFMFWVNGTASAAREVVKGVVNGKIEAWEPI